MSRLLEPRTYFAFHRRFTFPVLAVLALVPAAAFPAGGLAALGWLMVAVYVFTSPWDNHAVARGIWDFPAGRFWRRVFHLPVEEYLFFGLQAVMVCQVVNLLVSAGLGGDSFGGGAVDFAAPSVGLPLLGVLAATLATGAWGWRGRRFTAREPGAYAWHLLFWFLPVIALQWAFGWGILAPRLDVLLAATAVVGTWLVAGDLVAIRQGLWFFDERQITGWKWRGVVPWEEIAFFYLTSLLVAQSYLVLLPEASR